MVQQWCGLIASVIVAAAGKDLQMAGRRHTRERIIRKLAEGQKLLAGGMDVEEVCRQFGIAESTWVRWLSHYGGMKADDAERFKELEGENARLKKLLAEAELDKAKLKEIAEGSLRSLRVPRSSAVKARTQAFLTLHGIVVGSLGASTR